VSEVLLEARGLDFGYGHNSPVFQNWDAIFSAGEVVAITGPSGRGKSTLLYLLGLMLKPGAGKILVRGHEVSQFGDARRAHLRATLFGFVFQDAALDATRTVLDNVIETSLYRGEAREMARGRAMDLMTQFGVERRASHKPGQVSGGQAQRSALCRALLNNPLILLADEPTGNLDSISSAVVVDALRAQADGGSTIVVATHDHALVAGCDRVVEL
jgi:ABC-type lipoprotein export system ATPase subunit